MSSNQIHESSFKHSIDEEEKDALEFNDLETDERINIDIFQFEMAFPDPKEHCIGFLVKPPSLHFSPSSEE
jgi:hypothetical protein